VLHCCYNVITLLSHCCYTVVTLLSHQCYTVVTLLLHCCDTVVTLLLHCCYTVVTLLLHCCYTVVTLLVHHSYTALTLLLHCRYTLLRPIPVWVRVASTPLSSRPGRAAPAAAAAVVCRVCPVGARRNPRSDLLLHAPVIPRLSHDDDDDDGVDGGVPMAAWCLARLMSELKPSRVKLVCASRLVLYTRGKAPGGFHWPAT
jgi:hypothetical protein